MTVNISALRSETISAKDTQKPFQGELFELSGSVYKNTALLDNDKFTIDSSDPRSPETVSPADLISAVSYAWNRARQPFSVLLPKTSSVYKPEIIQEAGNDIFNHSTARETPEASTSNNSAKIAKENVEKLNPNNKITGPRLSYEYFPFWRMLHTKATVTDEPFSEKCVFRAGNLQALIGIYGWMSETASKRTNNVDETSRLLNSSSIRDSFCSDEAEQSVGRESREVVNSKIEESTITCSDNRVVHAEHVEESKYDTSSCNLDVNGNLSSLGCHCDSGTNQTGDIAHENQNDKSITFTNVDIFESKPIMSVKKNTQYALAKHEHAFAGAMAGIFVSLCLHPVDTIKTVVQSSRADQRSLSYVSRSIISERGLTGLYRGISSNIVASAPVSALYTFTYESAKKSLLPIIPKEYHSLAHCMAGGSASIATSFIFTPSERIKQQMQVGSHYKNSWNALTGIVKKGGLPSLYAGWGAVLCRNIPHSVIKFYTYENLKQVMLPSVQPNAQPSTIVLQLFCGGLAASTASLFSTPFDVVKTRLQTQIPGSVTQYNGVLNTLIEIGKNESLKGLYRGLTPRLVVYMIHGALFFASYESFKQFFFV